MESPLHQTSGRSSEILHEHQVAAGLIPLRVENIPSVGGSLDVITDPPLDRTDFPRLTGGELVETDVGVILMRSFRYVARTETKKVDICVPVVECQCSTIWRKWWTGVGAFGQPSFFSRLNGEEKQPRTRFVREGKIF